MPAKPKPGSMSALLQQAQAPAVAPKGKSPRKARKASAKPRKPRTTPAQTAALHQVEAEAKVIQPDPAKPPLFTPLAQQATPGERKYTRPTPAAPSVSVQEVRVTLPPLYPWQLRVKAALERPTVRFVIVSAARQIGKTEFAVWIAMQTLFKGGVVWWIAPTFDLANAGYDKLRFWLGQAPFKQDIRENKKRQQFVFIDGRPGSIEVKSADDPQTVVSGTNDLVIFDEAARAHPDAWFEGAYSTLTVRRGKALLISNPRKNWFSEIYRKGDPTAPDYDPEYASFMFSQYDNPVLTKEYIEKQATQMPWKKYEREVLGKFSDEGGEVFRNVREAATIIPGLPPLGVYNPAHRYVFGVDLSAGRQDYTVIMVFDVTEMAQVGMYRVSEPDLHKLKALLWDAADYWHPELIEVEENAAGLFAVPEFQAMGLPIRPWNANWKSKRESIENYAAAIELGRIRLLYDPQVVKEHEGMEATVTANTVQYNSPKGGNDDTVTGGHLAYRAATVRDEARPLSFVRGRATGLYDTSHTRQYPGWGGGSSASPVPLSPDASGQRRQSPFARSLARRPPQRPKGTY